MYEERSYRAVSRPSDLLCYEVQCKETDLLCCTTVDLKDFITERVLFYRNQLEQYIAGRPEFRESLVPVVFDRFAPEIAREMMAATSALGIGPMASVAGAVAEFVGRDIAPRSPEFILENGGDIFLKTHSERVSLIFAKNSPYSGRIGVKLKPATDPYGICTSSATVGPSLSLGKADAVVIMAPSSLFADGLATYVGNGVKNKRDIPFAIERGSNFPGVKGILVILGNELGAWGDIEIVKV